MQPIRQILIDAPDVIAVPSEFRHQRLEVIFWPLTETTDTKIQSALETVIEDIRGLISDSKPVELGEFRLDLTGFHFNREEANAR